MLKFAIPGIVLSVIGLIFSWLALMGFENGKIDVDPEVALMGALGIIGVLWIVNIILWIVMIL